MFNILGTPNTIPGTLIEEGGESTTIVVGGGSDWKDLPSSFPAKAPSPPDVFTLYILGGGVISPHPIVLQPLRLTLGLLVLTERVEAWLRPLTI